ncbi:MAG: sigma 54-interacting transcriptional regulator, partial [Planctomycetota bacterium]
MFEPTDQNRSEVKDNTYTGSNLNCRTDAKTKKIGNYLIEDLFCDNTTVNRALAFQKKLKENGTYKPIGQIIVEGDGLEPEALKLSLRRQGLDTLFLADLFKSLPSQMILTIAEVSEYLALPKNTVVFQQGDQGSTFYLVISGLVRIYQVAEDGMEVTLATLGPGEGIGDMALLTGEPRSASVDTIEATSLLQVSKKDFDEIVAANPEFSMAFNRLLAERVSKGNVHLVEASANERAYQRFASERYTVSDPQLIGKSKAIRKLRTRIKAVAQNDQSVMILGESGTETRDVAGLIHRNGKYEKNPFLVMDAKAVNLGGATVDHDKRDPLRLELAQNSTLFGHNQGALPIDNDRRLGLLQVAQEGTVLIENVEQLAGSVQAKLIDFIQNGYFLPMGGQTPIRSSARIIATSSIDLGKLVESGEFDQNLYNVLYGQTLTVKPLRRRKRDLNLLVEHFIEIFNEQAGKSVRGISKEAYKSIMTYNWPGNTDELKVVIRRAVNLAQSEWLIPENIFIGLAPISGKLTFNLLKLNRILRLFQNKAFPGAAQFITGVFFTLILCAGYFGSQMPDQNVSLVLTWGIWEPLVILSIIPAARLWCAVCPVGALTSLLNRYYSLKQDVP